MKMKLLFLATVLLTSTLSYSQNGPSRDEYAIDGVAINGSACPVGTRATYHKVETGTLEGLVFSIEGFDVTTKGDTRGFCNLAINIKHTAGWSYGVSGIGTLVYGNFQQGVKGSLYVSTDIRGTGAKTMTGRYADGPFRGVFNVAEQFSSVKFSPCGRNLPLNVKIDGRLEGNTGSGEESFFSVLPYKRAIEQGVRIVWRRC